MPLILFYGETNISTVYEVVQVQSEESKGITEGLYLSER